MKVLLVMRTPDGRERPFPLRLERTVIGREVRCDLRLAVPTVDNRHCELTFDNGEITLNDLGSNAGTFHNGRRVDRATLHHADTLTVGPVTFEVRMQHEIERENRSSARSASTLDFVVE